jgi:hypothetical protein
MQHPDSALKKKSNIICYHAARESAAMGECSMVHVRSENNPAGICTKVVPAGQTRYRLIGLMLYDLPD